MVDARVQSIIDALKETITESFPYQCNALRNKKKFVEVANHSLVDREESQPAEIKPPSLILELDREKAMVQCLEPILHAPAGEGLGQSSCTM